MNILTAVTNALGGNIFESILKTVKDYFPPSMSDTEKAQAELALMTVAANKELQMAGIMQEIQAGYEQRIRDMEGTAADLKAIPILGQLIIFLRGMQRPVWGFAVLVMDYFVFAGDWKIVPDSRQDTCFLIINFLVLGFLFGERALQNLAPLIERLLLTRNS